MIEEPRFRQFEGKGVLTSGHDQISVEFNLQLQFSQIILEAEVDLNARLYLLGVPLWSLSGHINDGREIFAERVAHVGESTKECALFHCLEGVAIGKPKPDVFREAKCHLIGMFEGEFRVEDSGWSIAVGNSEESFVFSRDHSIRWGVPLEGLTLRISKKETTANEYDEKARDITSLLSLSMGNGVTHYKQILIRGDQDEFETWRARTGDEIGPGPVVPIERVESFLEQTLPLWNQLNANTKSDMRLAIAYINLSGTGYLDTKLFQIAQAWEFLAAKWMPKSGLSDSEKDLRNKVKCVYRDWKNRYQSADPQGYWGSRVVFPFQWASAKRQIESLADQLKVDLAKVELDLELLKRVRDSVAHTGKITEEIERGSRSPLLLAARFGLRLLLLRKLGYSDLVIDFKNQVRPITAFLKNTQI